LGIVKKSPLYLLILLAITVIALGLVWVGEYALDDRIITLRYFLFLIAGLIAFVTPYLLFPDSNTMLIQLGNLTGKKLVRYLLLKLLRYHWPLLLLFLVMVLGDLNSPFEFLYQKSIYFVFSVLVFIGLNLIALNRYVKSGVNSQFWQESERGRELRKKFADYAKYPLDPGSIPSLINTLLITTTGMIAIVISASLSNLIGTEAELIVATVIFFAGVMMVRGLNQNPERDFYVSNAFYREFFGSDLEGETIVERRKVDQLWWVPSPIRAGVWQFLQQIDRKLPAGRAVAVGHFFLWFIAYQRPSEEFITALWIVFAVAHQLFVVLTLHGQMAPNWLLRWVGSGTSWFAIRVWMQFRWLIPLVLSMNAQLFVFGLPGWPQQSIVFLFFILSAMTVSGIGVVQLKKDFK
jgi:hypothetical protein